jgi:3-keto-L-gulonate-6-phosphate decarboxylase
MANTTFDGPVRSKNGFINLGPNAIVANTLATDMTVAANAGRIMLMDPVGTPTAITIPSIVSTADSAIAGPGSDPNNASTIGTTFEILFTDDFTGTIQTANTADKFIGMVTLGIDASTAGKQFVPAATNNEMNLNGEAGAAVATTGGLKGSYVKFTAVAANLYLVQGLLNATGTLATPFADQ